MAIRSIKAAREELGETQAEFGARFGVDQSTVQRWEANGLPEKGVAKKTVEGFLASFRSPRASQNAMAR